MYKLQIDMETAQNITRLTLTEYRDYLQHETDLFEANPKDDDNLDGYWLHPNDLAHNYKMVKRIDKVLKDFGGELYGKDKFDFELDDKDGTKSINIKRTDSDSGWGQNLKIKLINNLDNSSKLIIVGNSEKNNLIINL